MDVSAKKFQPNDNSYTHSAFTGVYSNTHEKSTNFLFNNKKIQYMELIFFCLALSFFSGTAVWQQITRRKRFTQTESKTETRGKTLIFDMLQFIWKVTVPQSFCYTCFAFSIFLHLCPYHAVQVDECWSFVLSFVSIYECVRCACLRLTQTSFNILDKSSPEITIQIWTILCLTCTDIPAEAKQYRQKKSNKKGRKSLFGKKSDTKYTIQICGDLFCCVRHIPMASDNTVPCIFVCFALSVPFSMSLRACVVLNANTNTSQFLHFRRLLLLLWCCYRKHNKSLYELKTPPHSIHLCAIQMSFGMYENHFLDSVSFTSAISLKNFSSSIKVKSYENAKCLTVFICLCVGIGAWVISIEVKATKVVIFGCTLHIHTYVRVMRWQNCFASFTWHEKPAFSAILRTKQRKAEATKLLSGIRVFIEKSK